MRFSLEFGVNRTDEDDWFDPELTLDTDLFVDPFLIFKEQQGPWATAHQRLIDHFNTCFELIAHGNRNSASPAYQKAVALLTFREPVETCIGYTADGTRGSGSGNGLANVMARAIVNAINRGLHNIAHFEELGIFEESIGSDRISDMTCTILKPLLIEYTKAVAARHGLETQPRLVRQARIEPNRRRWVSEQIDLPVNPSNNAGILLVPQRFLARLPTINAEAWWGGVNENAELRADLNLEILGTVNKHRIVEIARQRPGLVQKWVALREQLPAHGYDFERDPDGRVNWSYAVQEFVAANPLALPAPSDQEQFFGTIDKVVTRFAHYVEERRGWSLLWDLQRERDEEALQLLFYGIASSYCEANNIVVDREAYLGRGPVDFKFSNGFTMRAHLEAKKLENSRFWDGLDAQLPTYLQADDVHDAWFLAVRFRDGARSDLRAAELAPRAQAASAKHGKQIRARLVDARPKPSASSVRA